MPLYRRTQALALRDKVFAVLEEAAVNGRDRDLRIVVVGGGATGVEMAGALTEKVASSWIDMLGGVSRW